MGGRRVRVAAWLAAAAGLVAFAASPAFAVLPDDLKLDRVGGRRIHTEPAPNPHATLPCTRCHTRGESSYEVAHRFGLQLPLDTGGESTVVLCERCHETNCEQHPVNFAVKGPSEQAVRRSGLPLETPLEGINKVTCTTCHAVHFPHTANRLLRGFPVDGRTAPGALETRADFCRLCHGEGFRDLSGHFVTEGELGCGSCHYDRDIAGRIGVLKPSLNSICSFCHQAQAGGLPHFFRYNPFPDFNREQLGAYGIVLEDGRFTCATCHVHHRPEPESPFLKPGYIAVVTKSIRVNPHQTTRFCLNCHPLTPPPPGTPGAIAPLIEEDGSRLCNGCHGKNGALSMHHPLDPPVEGGPTVPAGWPRRENGSLGCLTCHLAGHAPQDPGNPRFLRGAPYVRRNDPCFRCHSEERVRGRNIHAEVGAAMGCEFCHEMLDRTALQPEGKAGPILAEPNLLCLPCHSPLPHPASAAHTVKPGEMSFLSIDAESAPLYRGKVTCHSCHDSHESESGGQLLRKSDRGQVCTNCHPF